MKGRKGGRKSAKVGKGGERGKCCMYIEYPNYAAE